MPRWLLRGFLLATGAGAAVVLAAGNASAAGLSVTPTTPANPTTDTPLTWDVTTADGSPTSCELDLDATVVSPLADCGPSVSYSVSGQPAGTYTLVAYNATAADVAAGTPAPSVSSSIDVAPPAPTPSGPSGPSADRHPQWALGLPSGSTGACTLTAASGAVMQSANPCPDPWTANLTGAADGTYTLSVTATQNGITSAATSLDYRLDTTPPSAPTVTAPASPGNDRTPTFAVSGVETGATLTCTAAGPAGAVPVTSCAATAATLGLSGAPDGTYTLHVTATDAAGNTSAAGSDSYTLDTTPPPAPTVSAPPALTNNRTVTLSISDSDTTATLTCTLTSPGGATVFSGACPASGSFDTTGFGDGVYTLVVTAHDAAGNTSSTTVTWRRDTTPPPAPVITGPTTPTKDRTPTLTVTDAEPAVTFTCTVSGPGAASVTSCGASTTLDLIGPDGGYTVTVTATDAAGNTSSSTFVVTLDTTAPPAPSVAAPRSPGQTRTPSFTVTDAEAGLTYRCSVSGPSTVTVTTCGPTTTLNLTGAADGTYVLTVEAIDAAGNVSANSTARYVLDTTAPPAPTVAGAPTLTNSRSVTVLIGDIEPGVTLTCRLTAPGGAVVFSATCPASGSFDTTGFADGVYTLAVTATDAAGNRSTTTITWTRDTIAPPAPVVTAPRSPAQSRTPSFTVTDAEAGVTYVCTVAGPSPATVTSCGPTTRLDLSGADGTYTLTVTVVDAAGNVSASTSATYVLDTTAPATPTMMVTASPSQGRRATFAYSGVEPGGVVTCSLSAPSGSSLSVPVSCAPSVTLDLSGQPDGAYTLTVTVTDAAGNVSGAAVATYVLDTTAPVAPGVTPPANPSIDTTPTFTLTTEPGATLTCTVARYFQVLWTGPCPADGTFDLTRYADGEFEVTVWATDTAGNVGPSTTAVYLLDTTAPSTPVLVAPASPSPVTNPTWLWTAEAGTTATCVVTDATGLPVAGPVSCTSPWTADLSALPDGAYTFTVFVTDAAGNSSPSTSSVFDLDRTAPVPPTVVPPSSPSNDLTPSWQISGPRGATLTCVLLRGRTVIWGPATCPVGGTFSLAGLPDGTYTLRVTATDRAGNVSAVAISTYALDTAPPPAPTLDYGSSSPSSDTAPFWGFTLPPATTGRCELLRGGTVLVTKQNCSGAVRFDLSGRAAGTYTIRIVAIDAAGNVSKPLLITYVFGQPTPVPSASGGGTTSAGGSTTTRSPRPPAPPAPMSAPQIVRQEIARVAKLAAQAHSGVKQVVQQLTDTVSATLPAINDRLTRDVSQAVQGVVNAVSTAGGGTGFPLILLFVVLAFLVMQNRIDRRDPKLALASVAADDTVEFLPPPSRGGDR